MTEHVGCVVRQRVNVSLGSIGTNFIAIVLHATGAGRADEFEGVFFGHPAF
jgi:hypothetical protein